MPVSVAELQYEVHVVPETLPPNIGVEWGTPNEEAEIARIRAEIEKGNMYGWCRVIVIARRGRYDGIDSCGLCQFANEEELQNSDILAALKAGALSDLEFAESVGEVFSGEG